jgi:hypothetical protein
MLGSCEEHNTPKEQIKNIRIYPQWKRKGRREPPTPPLPQKAATGQADLDVTR